MTCHPIEKIKSEKQNTKQSVIQRMIVLIASVLFITVIMVGSASADMTTDMQNFTTIMGNFTTMFTSMMTLFMQPPLVYFVVLGLFITFIGLTSGLLMRRKRRR